jgi:hypothetical protein
VLEDRSRAREVAEILANSGSVFPAWIRLIGVRKAQVGDRT